MTNADTVSELAMITISAQRVARAQEIAMAMLLGGSLKVQPGDGVDLVVIALGVIAAQLLDDAKPGHRATMREAMLGILATMTEDEA